MSRITDLETALLEPASCLIGFPLGSVQIVPNGGIAYENTATNELKNQNVALTGGYSLVGIAGLELSVNRVQIGFNIQGPFSQGFADGQTTLKNRGMAHITYVF